MSANPPKIETKIARTEAELRAAARLRYDVFVSELGGDGDGVDHELQQEHDHFDEHALQLIAIDRANEDRVVGVYRLMTHEIARRAGRFYSEDEYDLEVLKASGRRLLELGRSCVDARYRGGTTMFHLWKGLAAIVDQERIEVLFGVASFHGTDPDTYRHALSNLALNYMAPDGLRATSRAFQRMDLIAPHHIDRQQAMKDTPALIKSYLRIGGMVGNGAFVDHRFNTIDVCLVVDTAQMSARHREIYAREQAG